MFAAADSQVCRHWFSIIHTNRRAHTYSDNTFMLNQISWHGLFRKCTDKQVSTNNLILHHVDLSELSTMFCLNTPLQTGPQYQVMTIINGWWRKIYYMANKWQVVWGTLGKSRGLGPLDSCHLLCHLLFRFKYYPTVPQNENLITWPNTFPILCKVPLTNVFKQFSNNL